MNKIEVLRMNRFMSLLGQKNNIPQTVSQSASEPAYENTSVPSSRQKPATERANRPDERSFNPNRARGKC
jgi:hypothetical protein